MTVNTSVFSPLLALFLPPDVFSLFSYVSHNPSPRVKILNSQSLDLSLPPPLSLYFSSFLFDFFSLFIALSLFPFAFPRNVLPSFLIFPLPLSRVDRTRGFTGVCMLTLSFARTTDKNDAPAAYNSKTRNFPSISCHVYLTRPIHFLIYSYVFPLPLP